METGHGEKKSAAQKSIAIIGFVVIAVIGLAIAVYAARFVPSAISGLAGAGAFVSDIFIVDTEEPREQPSRPEEPEEEEPSTPSVDIEEPEEEEPASPAPSAPRPSAPAYSGFPDLRADIVATGYCTSRSQGSFVRASSVPRNAPYAGAQFMLSNAGTNVASGWTFAVDTPQNERIESVGVRLLPGQSATGITCFPYRSGANEVSVMIDARGQVMESNEANNADSERISAQGSVANDDDEDEDDLWCDIDASDRTIDEGDSTDLEFEIEGADEARINNGVGSVDEDGGEERVRPREDTTYRLTVENDDGDTETCSVTIEVDEN